MAPKYQITEEILENEKEWRRIIYSDLQKIKDDVSGLRVWNLVFRAAGATLFGLLFAYIKLVLEGK